MKNIIIRSLADWAKMDRHQMRACINLAIRDVRFPRGAITIDHYFPEMENLLIDKSGPLPWLINQLVNDGRTPNLRTLFVTEDVSRFHISPAIKIYTGGESATHRFGLMLQ
jgi:hypothetical protein